MNRVKIFLAYLMDKPRLGILSGFVSFELGKVHTMLTDEQILRAITFFGGVLGATVAGLTVILKVLELYDNIKKRVG